MTRRSASSLALLLALLLAASLVACDPPTSSPDGGAADTDAGPFCELDEVPAEESSAREVTFRFTRSDEALLVTGGSFCSTFELERQEGGEWVRLELGYPYLINCEGPPPPTPYSGSGSPFSAAPTLTWDGLEILLYRSECIDCCARGWCDPSEPIDPSDPWRIQTGMTSVWRRAGAGRYRATFGIVDAVPYEGPPDGTTGPLPTCPAQQHLRVEFDLPESGDLEVLVP